MFFIYEKYVFLLLLITMFYCNTLKINNDMTKKIKTRYGDCFYEFINLELDEGKDLVSKFNGELILDQDSVAEHPYLLNDGRVVVFLSRVGAILFENENEFLKSSNYFRRNLEQEFPKRKIHISEKGEKLVFELISKKDFDEKTENIPVYKIGKEGFSEINIYKNNNLYYFKLVEEYLLFFEEYDLNDFFKWLNKDKSYPIIYAFPEVDENFLLKKDSLYENWRKKNMQKLGIKLSKDIKSFFLDLDHILTDNKLTDGFFYENYLPLLILIGNIITENSEYIWEIKKVEIGDEAFYLPCLLDKTSNEIKEIWSEIWEVLSPENTDKMGPGFSELYIRYFTEFRKLLKPY